MFSLALAATTALSLASLVSAQSPLDIAVIEAHFTNAGIVPDLLKTFVPSATLNASFSGVGAITPGEALSKDQVAPAPVLTINPANSSVTFSGNYTVVMADADIVGTDESKGQTRHWLVNSVPIDNGNVSTSSGTEITSYAGPGPAAGSGAHRYVILILPQPDNFSPPANLSSPGVPVSTFDLNDYITSSNLGQPVAGIYFTVEEGTATVTVSTTQAVNTASLSAALASQPASKTGSASASSASPTSHTSGSGPSAAVALLSGPFALVALLHGLLVL